MKPTLSKPLARLLVLLRREFLTVRQIARKQRCSRLQAYRRIKAIKANGFRLAEVPVRERKTGPLAISFRYLS